MSLSTEILNAVSANDVEALKLLILTKEDLHEAQAMVIETTSEEVKAFFESAKEVFASKELDTPEGDVGGTEGATPLVSENLPTADLSDAL